ncbi:hypothetical protein QQ045_000853 [Rhodiola kirilowii]
MEESTSSKDAIKQKILQRGSDRMVFITGRVPSLGQTHVGADCSSDIVGQSEMKLENDENLSFIHDEILTPSSIIRNPVNDQEIYPTQPNSRNVAAATFSARKISSCIIASEPTRSICSLTIALLVVFSYIDKPVLGWNLVKSESIVASRPLYILLLTDLSIIFARLHLERRKIIEYADEEQTTSTSREGQTWAGAVKVLENGLVVYQTIRAVFIDFSIYTVVVVLGLSFV